MRVIVTRARADAERTAAALRARGHEPLLSPVLAIVRTGAAVHPGQAQALVATSAHAFEAISADEASSLAHLPLFVVGARTAEAAERAGLAAPRLTAAQVSGLAAQMGSALPAGAKLLYLAGRDRKPDLEEALADQRPGPDAGRARDERCARGDRLRAGLPEAGAVPEVG